MIILVGPSASGKTQIGYSLKKIYGLEKVVTYTTRRMRSGEVDGIDYHFITKDEFLRLEKEGINGKIPHIRQYTAIKGAS